MSIEGLRCEICKTTQNIEQRTQPLCVTCHRFAGAHAHSRGIVWYTERIDCARATENEVTISGVVHNDFKQRFLNPNDWNGFPCLRCRHRHSSHGCRWWEEIYRMVKDSVTGIQRRERLATVKDGITNKEIADHLGISKRQVAKMRAAGEIDIERIKREMKS